jgi:D-glycero-alpha-D-manno-heptose-7-phosphate kinase
MENPSPSSRASDKIILVDAQRHAGSARRNSMLVRGKVPLRIGFCGGGTDVAPYCDQFGGRVISSTVDMYAYATLEPRNDDLVNIKSLDFDTIVKYDIKKSLAMDHKLRLITAIADYMGMKRGFNLFIHNDAPPGSGMGSSGAIGVMLVAMIADLLGSRLSRSEIADTAIHVEREILKISGGRQDQYAAVYGGFNYIEFFDKRTIVHQLRIDRAIVRELEYQLMLVYTSKTHYSHDLIDHQVKLFEKHDHDHLAALEELKVLTKEMTEMLVTGRILAFGDLLHQAWQSKVKMNPLSTTPYVEELYAEARRLGARGGKILGAGGGGYILLFCPFQDKHLIARRMEEMGSKIVDFSFEEEGLQIWHIPKKNITDVTTTYVLNFD